MGVARKKRWKIPDSLEYRVEELFFSNNGVSILGEVYIPERFESGVLIHHGGFGNSHSFEKYAGFLASNGYLAYCLDARGHGRSDARFDVNGMVDDACYIISELKGKYGLKSMGMMGQSMGGFVTGLTAAAGGDLSACILISPAVSPLDDICGTYADIILRGMDKICDRVNSGRIPKEWFTFSEDFFHTEFESRGLEGIAKGIFFEILKKIRNVQAEKEFNLIDLFTAFREAPSLMECTDEISLPVYIFHGRHDPAVPVRAVERFFLDIAGSDKKLFLYTGKHNIFNSEFEVISGNILELFERTL